MRFNASWHCVVWVMDKIFWNNLQHLYTSGCSSELLIPIHHPKQWYNTVPTITEAWNSSVGIVTRYGLDGLGIESRWGRDFPPTSRSALGSTQPPVQWVTGLSRGVKRLGRGVDHPPPSSAEVEGQVKLYICSPSGSSWPVLGCTSPVPLPTVTGNVSNYFHHTRCNTKQTNTAR